MISLHNHYLYLEYMVLKWRGCNKIPKIYNFVIIGTLICTFDNDQH